MKYYNIVENDIVNGVNGLSVSFWTQGCPHHCKGCHNKDTWSYESGSDLPDNYVDIIKSLLIKNGVKRNLSILGGEPLDNINKHIVFPLINMAHDLGVDIIIWTGYELDELKNNLEKEEMSILKKAKYLITGRYIEEKRDITLALRGSSNQRILLPQDNFKLAKDLV